MQICSVYMHNGLNQWMKRLIYAWMNLEETLAKQRTLGDGLTEWTSKGSFSWFPKGNILEFTNATVNFKISRKCNFCEATHICTIVDAFKGKDVKCEAVGKIVEMTAELM